MAPAIIKPTDGGSIADPAKNGTARCQCCGGRYSWGHPPASAATWHLYEDDGKPHCRWAACKPHAVTATLRAGKSSTLCPSARPSSHEYFAEFPPKGKRTYRGRAPVAPVPATLPEPARTMVAESDASAAPTSPKPARRRQRTMRAPVGAPAPVPVNAPSVVLDSDHATPGEDPLASLLADDDGNGVTPDGLDYTAQDGEVEAIERAIRLGQNVLVLGPPGCGKTQLIRHIVGRIGRKLVTVLGADGVPRDEIIGRRDIVSDGKGASVTMWRDGLIPAAMREGAILYIDEINALPSGIRSAAYSALDSRREITLAENGNETVHAAPGFIGMASMNAEGFAGTTPLAPPLLQRMECIIRLDYLPADREAKLLRARVPGLAASAAAVLVDIAAKLREAKSVGRKLPKMAAVGTRTLLACGARIADGEDVRTACRLTIGGLTVDAVEYKVVLDTIDACAPAAQGAR